MTTEQLSLFEDPGVPRKGLVIREPWARMVVEGQKRWEIRGSRVQFRGLVAIIASGTGTIVGTCELVDCIGPLTLESYNVNCGLRGAHDVVVDALPYCTTYAWAMAMPRQFSSPVTYDHPNGAVIWVNLSPETREKITEQWTEGNR